VLPEESSDLGLCLDRMRAMPERAAQPATTPGGKSTTKSQKPSLESPALPMVNGIGDGTDDARRGDRPTRLLAATAAIVGRVQSQSKAASKPRPRDLVVDKDEALAGDARRVPAPPRKRPRKMWAERQPGSEAGDQAAAFELDGRPAEVAARVGGDATENHLADAEWPTFPRTGEGTRRPRPPTGRGLPVLGDASTKKAGCCPFAAPPPSPGIGGGETARGQPATGLSRWRRAPSGVCHSKSLPQMSGLSCSAKEEPTLEEKTHKFQAGAGVCCEAHDGDSGVLQEKPPAVTPMRPPEVDSSEEAAGVMVRGPERIGVTVEGVPPEPGATAFLEPRMNRDTGEASNCRAVGPTTKGDSAAKGGVSWGGGESDSGEYSTAGLPSSCRSMAMMASSRSMRN